MLKERLDIENVETERAHRAGRKNRNKPRTIVCKILPFKDKQNILRKAKLQTEISREQLFVKSYHLKTNKTF